MWKILQYQSVDFKEGNKMPSWLEMLLCCSKNRSTKICLVTIEMFIKLLYYQDKSKTKQQGGTSIMHIQKMIADASVDL